MDLKFVVNDYVLIWNLLFGPSISEAVYKLKQKLWVNYKKEYNNTYKDKKLILNDPKNFIPSDDTIYNILLETKEYEKLERKDERYRLEVMRLWDVNKKKINSCLEKIIKKEIKPYEIYIVNEELDILDITDSKEEHGIIILGKKIDKKEPLKIIIDLLLAIIKREIKDDDKPNQKEFREATIELAILNELATSLTGESHYKNGSSDLAPLKRKLYPYWLMYLNIPKEDFSTYMKRDKIFFDKEQYAYEKEFKKMNLEEFIDFCTRNKKYIVRPEKLEII